MVQQFMQKKCIQLILLWIIKNFVEVYIIMVIIAIYIFVNEKDSEIVPYPLCLGNIST